MMILIPAIDIKDKKCVRLYKGDYDKETIYSDNPLEVAKKWIEKQLVKLSCNEPKWYYVHPSQ